MSNNFSLGSYQHVEATHVKKFLNCLPLKNPYRRYCGLMVEGGFSPLGNCFSVKGLTFMIYQGILEKIQFEWKKSVKLVESRYGSILLLCHLCSSS